MSEQELTCDHEIAGKSRLTRRSMGRFEPHRLCITRSRATPLTATRTPRRARPPGPSPLFSVAPASRRHQ